MPTDNEGYRLHEWGGPLRWERWALPDPPPGEVQVAVEACGVGATVLNNSRGENWPDPTLLPRVPGHEVVGRVVSTGSDVSTPAVGDRVLAYFYLSCFACRQCAFGREERCERSAGRYGVHRDGGYARLTNLPAGNALPLPESVAAADATVIADAVATSVHVCRFRLGLGAGDRVVVLGAGGGVGAHRVQVAQACDATVVGLDRGAPKLSLVESLGATPVDSTRFDDVRLDDWGGRADAVVDLVGSEESLGWAVQHLDQGGRVCVLTTFRDVVLPVAPRDLVSRELAVLGSHYASRREVGEAARLVTDGAVRPVVGAVVAAGDVEHLHDALRAGSLLGRGAVVWSE